ncbi:MAG: DUF1353 domain-containing protein [Actinomycetota bacterium]
MDDVAREPDARSEGSTPPNRQNAGPTAPWGEFFLVNGVEGAPLPLTQVNEKDFTFTGTLEFVGDMGLDDSKVDPEKQDAARTLTGTELGVTDLASIPLFVRWFVGPYGRHTPAALIHDHLIISKKPNEGTLGSDIAADRYWRYMLQAVGTPWIQRWIMWTATALRTRWAVGGLRRWTVLLWAVLATAGITAAVWSTIAVITDSTLPGDTEPGGVLAVALALPIVASALWGRQFGAGLVAAGAAVWLLPPTIIAGIGFLLYWLLERIFGLVGLD